MSLPSVEQLINSGPSTPEQASAAANAVKEAASTFSNDDTKAATTLDAFEKVKSGIDPQKSIEDANKKELEKEEAVVKKEEEGDSKDKGLSQDNKELEKAGEKKSGETGDDKKFTPPTAKTKAPPQDDFNGLIPQSALPFFKKMSNDAKEWVIAELKRNARQIEEFKAKETLAKTEKRDGLPDAWYEHPQSYVLTPEFQQLNQQAQQIQLIENHFRQQLIAIKEGEEWADLVQGPDGKISQVMRKADAASDVHVSNKIAEARTMLQQLGTMQQGLVQKFQQNAFNHRDKVRQMEDEWFPQYKDEKENEKNEHLVNVRKIQKLNGIDNDRTAGFLAKLYAFAMETIAENEELKSRMGNGEDSAAKLAAKNGPTGDEINKGEGSKTRNVDPDDLPFQVEAFKKYAS